MDVTSRRDRKKQQTRSAIGDAAMRLFLARGFDTVTIAGIAQDAEVTRPRVPRRRGARTAKPEDTP